MLLFWKVVCCQKLHYIHFSRYVYFKLICISAENFWQWRFLNDKAFELFNLDFLGFFGCRRMCLSFSVKFYFEVLLPLLWSPTLYTLLPHVDPIWCFHFSFFCISLCFPILYSICFAISGHSKKYFISAELHVVIFN